MFPNILSSSPLGQIDGAHEHPAYHQGHFHYTTGRTAGDHIGGAAAIVRRAGRVSTGASLRREEA